MAQIPIALQLYTVRDLTAADFTGTLQKVAGLGYSGVELAGDAGLSAPELRKLLADLGLEVAGSHVGLDRLEGYLTAVLDYYAELGCEYLVCPYLPENRRQSGDDYAHLGELLNDIGEQVRDAGMTLCYHNHAFELQEFDGRAGLDILYATAFPDLVKAEIDTYWLEYGGRNAAEAIRDMGERVRLVHLKDMAAGESRTFAEVGEGTMEWPAIFTACEEAGVDWYIVEQDVCQRPSLESAALSLQHLRDWGMA